MPYLISSILLISLVLFLAYCSKKYRVQNDYEKAAKKRFDFEDGINWYEESGAIDPETFNRLKIKNKVYK